jgi:hypothetical protein
MNFSELYFRYFPADMACIYFLKQVDAPVVNTLLYL